MTDCDRMLEAISRLLDGELDAEEELALRRHLAGCPACRQRFEALRAFSAALRGGQAEAPKRVRENVMAELRREALRRRNRRVRTLLTSAAAVAALALGLRFALQKSAPDETLSAAVRGVEKAVYEVQSAEEAAPAERAALYRAAASGADAALSDASEKPTLAALLAYLDGTPLPADAEPGEALAPLTLADGALTLYDHGGALRFRDPASGALLETARSLAEIEDFIG